MEPEAAGIITELAGTTNLRLAGSSQPHRLSLAKRVRAGIGWNASSSLLGQIIGFVRSVVIARLLFPDEFGLFSMALTIVLGLNALTTIGLDQTILARQFKNDKEFTDHLNTVWSAELLRSFFLGLLVLASAYPLARFYGQPKLTSLMPILSLTMLIDGCRNIGLAILRKQISFARIFWYEVTTNITAAALTIVLVFLTRNVWALVLGQLISALLGMTLSYVFHPYRPRFAFEKTAFSHALNFGKFALVIAVASYVTTMADNVMVGRLLGPGALGNYALAYNLASFPIGVLVFALSKVTLPAFAELAASVPGRIDRAFTKVFTISSLILISMLVPFFLLSGDIVKLLYGSKWTAAGPALRILALIIPLRGLMLIISSLFFGLNRPRAVATGKALEAVVFLALLYPLTRAFGLTGAAWAGVITYGVALINRLIVLRSVLPDLSAKLMRVSLSALAACGAGILIAAFGLSFLHSSLSRLVVGGLLATMVPALLLLLMRADLRKWIVETAH